MQCHTVIRQSSLIKYQSTDAIKATVYNIYHKVNIKNMLINDQHMIIINDHYFVVILKPPIRESDKKGNLWGKFPRQNLTTHLGHYINPLSH